MTPVLLIEDDEKIAAAISAALDEIGFTVRLEASGTSGHTAANAEDLGAIILDLGLPDTDGLDLLRSWREQQLHTPVLILTARGSWIERVKGIEAGADDYLPKPFHMEELIARLRALLRRAKTPAANATHNREDLTIDEQKKLIVCQGRAVALTPSEFRVVSYLAQNSGRIVSAGELIAHVHGADHAVTANAIEALIGRVRRKLDNELIETRRGFGYIIPEG